MSHKPPERFGRFLRNRIRGLRQKSTPLRASARESVGGERFASVEFSTIVSRMTRLMSRGASGGTRLATQSVGATIDYSGKRDKTTNNGLLRVARRALGKNVWKCPRMCLTYEMKRTKNFER